MTCHICKAEAVTRCYNCGELVCEQHSKTDVCASCSTGIVPGDPRAVSERPLPKQGKHGWWRPQEAEEYVPPACYECQGLSRGVCRNCQNRYCPEHAGPNGLCKDCGNSANLGTYVLLIMAVAIGLFYLGYWLFYS